MTRFIKLTNGITAVFTSIAGAALIWMMLLLVGNIVLRLIGAPIQGTYELMSMTTIFVLGFALAQAQVDKSHVALDLVMVRRSKSTQLIVGAVVTVLSIAIFAQLIAALWSYGLNQRATGSTTESLQIPYWPSVFALLAGVVALLLVLVADLARIVQSARSANPEVNIW